MKERTYLAIDLKSFYASVECAARGLDPMDTALVVADESRTDKTICLAVSPALKAYGIPGRCRLFEVKEKVREANEERRKRAPGGKLSSTSSVSAAELRDNPSRALGFITAKPRMSLYMRKSAEIYGIYLKSISPDDIYVYSIDEVFIDATDYLALYHLSAEEFARKLILSVLEATGITATAGIGENLYLAKVAMDIRAKHIEADENGVRIARLDEMEYRRTLWTHRPLTDFWRVGRGYARKLAEKRIFTMGDIARCSVENEEVLYRLFGVNAELLIDHAWGWEPCTMKDIKAYRPASSSIGQGQVLPCGYDADKAGLALREMAEMISLDLVEKGLAADQIALSVGYDIDNIRGKREFHGETKRDFYGRTVPKSASGSLSLGGFTSSSKRIMDAAAELYEKITNRNLIVRRLYLTALHVIPEREAAEADEWKQGDLFPDDAEEEKHRKEAEERGKERSLQQAALSIKKKFGRNAILRGMSYEEGATAKERNMMIGGHNA